MSIKVNNVSVLAGQRKLVDNVSFEARSGEVLAVLGANGAGKSTLLKTLCGEVSPTSGSIEFGQMDIGYWKIEKLSKARGVLPQSFALNFPFRVREVALLGRIPHISFKESKRDHEIVNAALKLVEADDLSDRFYPTLSGGERQRVQLARVLAQIWDEPDGGSRYLILDEPTSNLDLTHQHLTLQTARKFSKDDTVVIAVLHDLNLAAQYADKILILVDGKRYAYGRSKDILTPDIIKEAFGIDVYVVNHAHNLEIPLIVPFSKDFIKSEAIGASAHGSKIQRK